MKRIFILTAAVLLLSAVNIFAADKKPIDGIEGYYITKLEGAESNANLIIVNEEGVQVTENSYFDIDNVIGDYDTIYVTQSNDSTSDEPYQMLGMVRLINGSFKEIVPCKFAADFFIQNTSSTPVIMPAVGSTYYYDLEGNKISEDNIYDFLGINNIDASDWAKAYVQEALLYNMIPEELQGNYKNNITRKEFCSLIVNQYNNMLDFYRHNDGYFHKQDGASYKETADSIEELADYIPDTNPFDDCKDSDVIMAYRMGIIKGKSNREFAPDDTITRQEAAVIIKNYFDFQVKILRADSDDITARTGAYSDDNDFSSWARDSIYYISGYYINPYQDIHIMSGTGDNKFSPLNNLTREQAISIILKLQN